MGTVDECAQVIRCSVQMRRCKKIYPIITPAEFPRELCDWHHLDHRNPAARHVPCFVKVPMCISYMIWPFNPASAGPGQFVSAHRNCRGSTTQEDLCGPSG